MNDKRKIKEQEIVLIKFLLAHLNLNPDHYPISELVDEYEGGVMGSIGMGDETAQYAGDLIQVNYTDADNIPVVITLTYDTNNQLLDLDFWKSDFSKLIEYPKPEKIEF
jgi:hypothetical protein